MANLNWSATCSYYSLVHGSRLLCFLALGDYPNRHAELRSVLSQRSQQRRTDRRKQDGYPFDWLRGFVELAGGQPHQVSDDEALPSSGFRQMIANYLDQVHVADAAQRLSLLGDILAAAGPLRNDSNYEALLIAHEYSHASMTEAFDKLSLHMATAAESVLPFFIDAFNGFLRYEPSLQQSRNQYSAFLHEYVHARIGDAIRRKLGHSDPLEAKLQYLLGRLDTRDTGASYSDLEFQVSMAVFGGKAQLMRNFEDGIENLARRTRPR